jgi:hypothetical protein
MNVQLMNDFKRRWMNGGAAETEKIGTLSEHLSPSLRSGEQHPEHDSA